MHKILEKWEILDAIGMKISISKLGITSTTSNTMYLEKIYEKVSLNFHSMVHLIKEIPNNEIDVNTIASCARNIMESVKIFFYFSSAFSNKKLSEFRIFQYIINHNRNTKDILEKLEIKPYDPLGFGDYGQKSTIFFIKNNPYFEELSVKDQEYIKNGGKRFHGLESPGIVEIEIESACYNLFSNSVHSLYSGISSNSLNPSYFNSKLTSDFLLLIAFELSGLYYANVIKEYLKKRHLLRKHLDQSEHKQIDIYSKDTDLKKCIDYYRSRNQSEHSF